MLVYFFAGLVILVIVGIYDQRNKAKKIFKSFVDDVNNNQQEWQEIISHIIKERNYSSFGKIIPAGANVYLISQNNDNIKVYSITNRKEKVLSKNQYIRLIEKRQQQKMFYAFNIDSTSIYYHFDKPHEDYILWIYCPNNFKLRI